MPIGRSTLEIIAYIVVSMLCAYGSGRIHQWYKRSLDRDQSFREGYNHGYRALFSLATRGNRGPSAEAEQAPDGRSDSGSL